MRTTLCICLLTLGVMMLFRESAGQTIQHPTCDKAMKLKKEWQIKECFEQKQRKGDPHAFMIKTTSNDWKCLDPNLPWLKKEINEGSLKCPPLISKVKQLFEVLDEVDLE